MYEQHRRDNWLATIVNPSTPAPNYYAPSPETNHHQHYHSQPPYGHYHSPQHLYSFDDSESISTSSSFVDSTLEPAQFDYAKDYHEIVTNTYGQPCTPPGSHDFHQPEARNDDEFPESVHQAVLKDRNREPQQEASPEKTQRKRRPVEKDSEEDVEKENTAPGRTKSKTKTGKKPKFKLTPAECQTLTEAVWDVEPFSSVHGGLLRRWEKVLEKVQSQGYFGSKKVPAIRTAMDRILDWHEDPEADMGPQVDEVLKGTREAIAMGALLDKISETKETADERTEEQKVKVSKKDDYNKKGGDAIRLNSMKTMRHPDSPRAPTSPRHYIPPARPKEVIAVDSDNSREPSPVQDNHSETPEVKEMPPPARKLKRRQSSQDSGRRTKRSKSFREGELLDPLLAAFRDGQEQQRRAQKSLEKKLTESVEKQNEVIREQTNQYVGIFKELAEAMKKN
ncbi:hypothetical protein C8R43DRAFT_1014507 [Mycena crocata]|nr:hypothetical protein C8R43DRAFT_1014507 [Mycena crocata]